MAGYGSRLSGLWQVIAGYVCDAGYYAGSGFSQELFCWSNVCHDSRWQVFGEDVVLKGRDGSSHPPNGLKHVRSCFAVHIRLVAYTPRPWGS